MIQFLLAAPASGSGKTTWACGLLEALKRRGASPCAFKCGPDYIDPMFHRSVLGVESQNLDLFFSDPAAVRTFYASAAEGHGAAVIEGAMGFYDGLGGVTTQASAWQLAQVLELPVLLVVRAKGSSLTLAAQIRGLDSFRTPSHLAGILLNDCTKSLFSLLRPMLERETRLPVLGYLPPMPEIRLPSRHLGLCTAGEIADLQRKISLLADTFQETVDWTRLLLQCERPAPPPHPQEVIPTRAEIAVAQDEAFCFSYAETLRALEQAGSRLRFFSPLRDAGLPEGVGGLYLPGGYPELYAKALAQNKPMLCAIRHAVDAGVPTVAECGGFLYLGQSLEDDQGQSWPMAGVLPGRGIRVGRLVRFGYAFLCAEQDSLLLRAGEKLPVHEFHHWDSTLCGDSLTAEKPITGKRWDCCVTNEHLYAGFPHFYWAGTPLPERFVRAAELFQQGEQL
ncbi:MAG: cobyrinate a,c-diamide synthase [Faecalibacterium sp.]